ncbi:hypothetical protein TASIC1_0014011200 [Trichoderma asperellum]|uniref:Uncharacterized protein n=2 Tax=Trichoderma asperellum TaxID=101201 RepID=A0A6V8R557_TRIAP|nr:hypothetical protein M441DRAFT_62724 [Trichoderma asperellum CBS 433.97]PTB35688.1 hypothetical protein M441DRAFT_62724 [Trichoderma asperellum CBS 433.97]UKZ94404.1 hypothetical protein TrAFT101_009276 [Trichoderma asperellum]GFP59690.1 hypothetical protein TASIC1_0014011200 [Trichoderma asperellum]
MLVKSVLASLSAATMALAATPLESGNWVAFTPGFQLQTCAGGSASGNTFSIPTSPNGSTSGSGCSNGHLRAENRYTDDYTSGVHQFAGTFKINSFGGNRVAIKQTFNGSTGPYFILGVQSDGTLYSVEGGAVLASGVAKVGSSITINTVHNADIHSFRVYVNGALAFRDDNAPSGSFYDKIGAYTTDSGTGPLSITWSDVGFWTRQ